MSNTLMKSASSWAAAVSGASMPRASKPCVSVRGGAMSGVSMPGAYLQAPGWRLRGRQRAMLRDLRGLRFEQLIQDDQGRSVFEHLIEDTNAPAPATAHVGVTKGGVSGPYPWRRPV
ncbi:hypothetical protein [Actinomadura monticuli]|uniref:Uncharacterized protein n=1 Tax=Actinomadura monticuli TaxID=3097367 RepID=A0ABV4QC47_9ACTN